jgi:alkylation response protein AidB-like acyl-CoA dehydrogenase
VEVEIRAPGQAGRPPQGLLRALRAVVPDDDAAELIAFDAQVGAEDRAKCRRDQAFTAQTARKAIDMLYEECGGSGLFDSSDLQRLWRDTNAAAAHHGLTWDWQAVAWTKTILGIPTPPGWVFTRA